MSGSSANFADLPFGITLHRVYSSTKYAALDYSHHRPGRMRDRLFHCIPGAV